MFLTGVGFMRWTIRRDGTAALRLAKYRVAEAAFPWSPDFVDSRTVFTQRFKDCHLPELCLDSYYIFKL